MFGANRWSFPFFRTDPPAGGGTPDEEEEEELEKKKDHPRPEPEVTGVLFPGPTGGNK